MSKVRVNSIAPRTTITVNFEGIDPPTWQNMPLAVAPLLDAINIGSTDLNGFYPSSTVGAKVLNVANSFEIINGYIPGTSGKSFTELLQEFMLQLEAKYRTPVGTVVSGYFLTPPLNTIRLNGAEVSRVTYGNLYNYVITAGLIVAEASWIGDGKGRFSTGDGSTTFRVPDLRGVFIRGLNDGVSGPDSGRSLGGFQEDEIKSHTHTLPLEVGGAMNQASLVDTGNNDEGPYGNPPTGATGGIETRPKNVALMTCIYY